MNMILLLGKAIFAIIWIALLALLSGLVVDMSTQAYGLIAMLLGVLVIMHLLLLGIFVATMKAQLPWKKGDGWQILIFGIFGWLTIYVRQSDD